MAPRTGRKSKSKSGYRYPAKYGGVVAPEPEERKKTTPFLQRLRGGDEDMWNPANWARWALPALQNFLSAELPAGYRGYPGIHPYQPDYIRPPAPAAGDEDEPEPNVREPRRSDGQPTYRASEGGYVPAYMTPYGQMPYAANARQFAQEYSIGGGGGAPVDYGNYNPYRTPVFQWGYNEDTGRWELAGRPGVYGEPGPQQAYYGGWRAGEYYPYQRDWRSSYAPEYYSQQPIRGSYMRRQGWEPTNTETFWRAQPKSWRDKQTFGNSAVARRIQQRNRQRQREQPTEALGGGIGAAQGLVNWRP